MTDQATPSITLSPSEIVLPLSPIHRECLESRVCHKFVKHLRHVPSSRNEVKILASIQYTADMLNCSDAHVSKILVDYGLRAPRQSFPETFLEHVDQSLLREPYEVGTAGWSYKELSKHWRSIGEDEFTPMRKSYAIQHHSFVHS